MNTPLDPLAMWSIYPGLASLVCLKVRIVPLPLGFIVLMGQFDTEPCHPIKL